MTKKNALKILDNYLQNRSLPIKDSVIYRRPKLHVKEGFPVYKQKEYTFIGLLKIAYGLK